MYSRTEEVPGLGTVRAEMGGQWIHNAIGNPVTALAKKYGLKMGPRMSRPLSTVTPGGGTVTRRWQGLRGPTRAHEESPAIRQRSRGRYFRGRCLRHVNTTQYLTPFVQVCDFFSFFGSI